MNAMIPAPDFAPATVSRHPFAAPFQGNVPEGETLAAFVARAVADGHLTLAEARAGALEVCIQGRAVPRAVWHLVRPKAGMHVLVRIRQAGGGGSGKKNPLRTLLSLLVVVAVSAISGGLLGPEAAGGLGLLGPAFAAGQVGAILAAGVASIALNALVNAIAPIPQPQLSERSQSYTLSGSRNATDPYGPCIVTAGKMRVTAKLATRPFTRTYNDETVLYMLFQWHVGKCELSELKVGDTLLSDFNDVTIQHRLLGEAYNSAIDLIPNLVIENPDIQIELKQVDGASIRSFPKQCFRVSLDLAAPGGLFESKDGSNRSKSVSFGVQYRAVGASTWINVPTGASPHMASAGVFTLNLNHPDAIRRTIEWEPAAGIGDYEVQVWRITADTSSTSIADEFYWLGVRGDRYSAPVLDDSLCVTAVRIVASGQLNGVIDQLNAIVEPIIPIYSGGNWSTEAKSRNPAAVFRWLHMGQAISPADALTWSEFDQAAINYWYGYCVTKGLTCDHVFDYQASVEEAAQLAASCGYASAAWALGKRTAIIDDTKVPTQLFTSETVRGFKGKIAYLDEVHALRCTFANAAAGYKPDEIIVYADGYDASNAMKFQQAEMPGKTLASDVWKAGRRLLKRAAIRRIGYEFEIDTECLVSRYGDRVLIEHFALHREAMSARVEAVMGASGSVTGVTLSEDVTMEYGTVYGLQIQRGADGVLALLDVTNTATSGVPVTGSTIGFTGTVLTAYEPAVGDLVVWGKKTAMTFDASLISLSPANDDFSASVVAVPYSSALFSDDGATAPAHQTFINASQSQGLILNPVATFSSLQAQVQAALLGVTAAAGDGVLTPAEKVGLVPQLKNLINTKAALDARATALSITTEKTAFDSAMSTLTSYLATLTTPAAWDSQSDTTTVDGPTLIADYRDALEKQIALQDAIDAEAAKRVEVVSGTRPAPGSALPGKIYLDGDVQYQVNGAGTAYVPVASVGAPAGTSVAGRSAALVLSDIALAATTAAWLTVSGMPANVAALLGGEAIKNSDITIVSGQIRGIGSGVNTDIANSLLNGRFTTIEGRATTLEASVNDGTSGLAATLARLVTEETTRGSADTALAARTSTLEAVTTVNPNLIPNGGLVDSAKGWTFAGGFGSGFDGSVGWFVAGSAANAYAASPFFAVNASYPFTFAADAGGSWSAGSMWAYLQWFDSGHTFLSNSATRTFASGLGYVYVRDKLTVTSPASAAYAKLIIGTSSDWVGTFALGKRAKVEPGSVATLFSDEEGVGQVSARLTTEEGVRSTADTALSGRTTTLETTVNHGTTGLAATLARLVTEEGTRATADTALSGRTTTLETAVNHGTTGLAATLARLVTEEGTRSTADTALAGRATTLEAVTSVGPNLIPNGGLVDGAKGWTLTSFSTGVGPTVGAYVLSSAASAVAASPEFAVSASSGYTLSADAGGTWTAGSLWAYLQWFTSGHVFISHSVLLSFATGGYVRDKLTVTSPATAAYAKFVFGTSADWVGTFVLGKRAKVEFGAVATLFSDEGGLGQVSSRLTTEEGVRSTADTALSGRATTLEATVNDGTTGLVATRARLIAEESTRASADTALASRATTLEAYTAVRPNLVPNATMAGAASGWVLSGMSTAYDSSVGQYIYATGPSVLALSPEFVANAGYSYTLSSDGGGTWTAGSAWSYIAWYNSSHAYIGNSSLLAHTSGIGYARTSVSFSAPTGTAYGRFVYGTSADWAGSSVLWKRPKLEPGTVASLFSDDGGTGVAYARIATVETVSADAQGKANAIYGFNLDVNGRVSGMKSVNNGVTSKTTFLQDVFEVGDSIAQVAPFRVAAGRVEINDALIRSLLVYPSAVATIAHKPQLAPNVYSGVHNTAVTFTGGGTYGSGIPRVKWAGGIPPALAAGETYDISAIAVGPTGFTPRAVKFTPGTPTDYSTTSTTNPGGTPAWRAPKPNTLDANGGRYVFKFSGTAKCVSSIEEVPASGNWETDWYCEVALYYRPNGGSFTFICNSPIAFHTTEASAKTPGSSTKAFTGWEAAVDNIPAIGADDGSKHFGIHPGVDATITAFTSVAYTATSTGTTTSLPGTFQFEVYPPT